MSVNIKTVEEIEKMRVAGRLAAEVLEILGVTDRVVGRGDFVVWPPSLQKLPRVGAYHAPSVEAVLSLEATLLLTTSSQAAQGSHARLRELASTLVQYAQRLHAENPEGSVVIQANNRSTNKRLVQVMDAARSAGVYNISIADSR